MEGKPEYLHPNREPNQKGHGDFYLKYDGESETQVRERVSDTVFRLVSQSDDDATILAVSHSGTIMSFFSALNTRVCIQILSQVFDLMIFSS